MSRHGKYAFTIAHVNLFLRVCTYGANIFGLTASVVPERSRSNCAAGCSRNGMDACKMYHFRWLRSTKRGSPATHSAHCFAITHIPNAKYLMERNAKMCIQLEPARRAIYSLTKHPEAKLARRRREGCLTKHREQYWEQTLELESPGLSTFPFKHRPGSFA